MILEVPDGLEPPLVELQSTALPTWLWNHHSDKYSITALVPKSIKILIKKEPTWLVSSLQF